MINLKELQEKVAKLGAGKHLNFKFNSPEEPAILIHTVKLNEEVGELCNDILATLQLQRKSKLERFEKNNIYQEFADVLIVLLQLAHYTNVDIERAVNDKIKKIEEKYLK